MKSSYQITVSRLQDFIKIIGSGDELILPEQALEDVTLASKLGVVWFRESETFPQGAYICSENAGIELLRLAWEENNLAAWQLSSKIAAHRLALRENLPEGLRSFAALVLSGELPKPPVPRQNKTWSKRMLTLVLIDVGTKLELLKPTRVDEKKGGNNSVCDAVAEVLSSQGIPTTYKGAKQLYLDNKMRDVAARSDLESWGKVTLAEMQKDPIAFAANSQLWNEFDKLFSRTMSEKEM